MQVSEDEVPKQWLPPYEGANRHSSADKKKPPKGSGSKESSSSSLQGLEQVLSSREGRYNSKPPLNKCQGDLPGSSVLAVAEDIQACLSL